MPISGFRELSGQLKRMGAANGGKALRNAAMRAMLPAQQAAKANAPVGSPPYSYPDRAPVDPYPRRTYKGRLVTPGFASRSVRRKSLISADRRYVTVLLGVDQEAFYAVNFVELGTSRTPAQPWLEPSFRSSLPAVDTRFQRFLKANIDKAIAR